MVTLLKNGYVVDNMNRVNGTDAVGVFDVFIKDGIIVNSCDVACESVDKIIDCSGLTVIPGICDMHVHLRDPGQTYKEDIISGSMAALAGGVTTVMCMPNTAPVISTPESVRDIVERAEKNTKVKVYPCASITVGLKGEQITDFCALKSAGAIAVSDDGRPVVSCEVMAKAMKLAGKTGLIVSSHCEDLTIEDTRISENTITDREIHLADLLNTHIHIAHVSTKEAVYSIRKAKAKGINVTCEAAPHHFTLTNVELLKRDADYLMNPPLREVDDVKAVIEGLHDGTIDCIASDHAPHSSSEKSNFERAPNGVLGLETILSVTLTQLYHSNKIPINRIVELLCVNPRRILGVEGGSLKAGNPADIAVIDINEEWVVEPSVLHSKSKNTCFKGMTLKGRVKYTIVNGEVVYDGT